MVDVESKIGQEVKALIGGISHSLAREFYGYTTAADVGQEMWVWVLKHDNKIIEWLDREEEIEWKRGMSALSKTLTRLGSRYCRKEKASTCGYRVQDEYFYSRQLLIALLVARENDGKLVANVVDDTPRKVKLDSEGNDTLAMLADLEVALNVLDDDQRELVIDVCGRDISTTAMALTHEVTRQAIENRVNRSLDRMIRELGGEYPY